MAAKSSSRGKLGKKKIMERLLLLSGNGKRYDQMRVPEDVKEGHFAVMTVDDHDQLRRFIVPLSFLAHPSFLQLLDQAAEEYGFDRDGALTLPCSPAVLHRILNEERERERERASRNHKCPAFMQ